MARAERRQRLDQPRASSRTLRPAYDPETFGRLSESIARFLGTGRFLVIQSVFIALWVIWNVAAPKAARFDPYTFTFLTLVLSLQAAYAAPLILLAQNRQDDRDRANLAQDRDTNARIVADSEYISREVAALRVALSDVVTRDYLRAELRSFVEDFDEQEHGQRDRKRKAGRPRAEREKATSAEREKVPSAKRDGAGPGKRALTPTGKDHELL
jgi:uncharacterized membrane protein